MGGRRQRLPSKITTTLTEGDKVFIVTPGGGGRGDPNRRDPEAVRRDVEEGFVSRERAGDAYGVVLDDGGRVDGAATRSRREK